ncbi:MAG TPA: M56 family metallopeptidase [Pirellulales bacterium]|nr:M56 family metallopeptidase [Pirellulales bacterium]
MAPSSSGGGREFSGTPLPTSSALSPSATHVSSPAPRFAGRISGLAAIVLSGLWFSIAAWLLAKLAKAWWRLGRIRHGAFPVDPATVAVCQARASKLGVVPPTVLQTPFLPSPCVAGVWNPVILLPEEGVQLPLGDVFIHELAHLLRKDCHWNLVSNLATSVFWFHPLLWSLCRRLKMAAEEVCDDFVVKVGGDRREYAERLLDFAEFASARMAMAGVAIVSLRSTLAHRVTRIMDTSRHLSTRVSRLLLACTLVGGLVGIGIVGFIGVAPQAAAAAPEPAAPEPAAPEPAKPEPAKPEKAAPEPAAVDPGEAIAKIEALGGTVERDPSQPGSPVTSVNLSGTGAKDDDLRLLSDFSSLRELYLIGTDVTDAGLKSLAGLQNLEEVRVGNCRITDAGLKELAKLKNLKMVGLIGTQVTDAGVKEFSEALPNMRHNLGGGGGGGAAGGGAAGGGGGGQRSDPDFDTSIAQPAYTDNHPAVLFDEAHHNFHTASGRYKPLASLITNDGYQVVAGTEPFTPQQLRNYQILISSNAMLGRGDGNSAFTSDECDAVEFWVKAGGSLLLVTDFEPWGSPSGELGKRFGVDMSFRVTYDPANNTGNGLLFSRDKNLIGDHPIMNGRNEAERVDRVLTWAGQSLKGPPGSTPLLKFADSAIEQDDGGGTISAAGRNQGLALEYGKGRVIVMGEAGELSAQIVGTDDRFGMNAPGCDNRKMALNMMHWLSNLKN